HNNITLNGVLVPQTTPANLATVSQLFTNYINFESSPVIAVGKSTTPINPIWSIQIGSMALAFTPETAWTPQTD
ncbi:hypothetical protein BDR03DRAFT_818585, partial [Suillus americanus]